MSLSAKARRHLVVALADEEVGNEVANAIDNAAESTAAATETTIGGVKMAANVAEAAGANPTAEEFKALLDALIAAGIMAPAEEE